MSAEGRVPDHVPLPPDEEIESLAGGAPPMTGAEYLTAAVLHDAVERDRRGVSRRALRVEGLGAGLSRAKEPGLASGRSRPLQPRREQEGRCGAVCVPGDLHDAAVGAREGAAPAARPGAARVRRRGPQGAAAVAAAAGAARRRAVRVAEADGGCRRDLSPAAVDAGRRVSTPDGSAATRSRRASSCACRARGARTVRRVRR